MSLINKVLKDLESRERATDDRRPPAPMLEDLRAAPTQEKGVPVRMYGWALGAIAAALIVVAGVKYGYRPDASRLAPKRPVVAENVVAPLLRPMPAVAAPLPPLVVARGGAVNHGLAAALKVPAAKVRALPTAPLTPVDTPRRVASRKAALAVKSSASFHFYSDGISRRAAPMTVAERSEARYRLAIAALQQGKTEAARRDLKAALGFVPGAARPSLLLAGLDVREGQLKSAQRVLTQGFALHPQANTLIVLLAQVDLRLGQAAEAVRVLAKVSPGSQTEPYWALLAASRLREGNMKTAVRTYEDGLEHFPHSGALWVGLGLANSERGYARAARKAFTQAQKCPLDPVLARFVQQELSSHP